MISLWNRLKGIGNASVTNITYGQTLSKAYGSIDREFPQKDPFIRMDHFVFVSPSGLDFHPHYGFEVINYNYQGATHHSDNIGNDEYLGPGVVQNMKCGNGILHAEFPVGVANGITLWLNLSKKNKAEKAKFQFSRAKDVPIIKKNGVTIKLLVGKAFDLQSKVTTETPSVILNIELNPGASHIQPVQRTWTSFMYVMIGEVDASGVTVQEYHTADIVNGDQIRFENRSRNRNAVIFFFSAVAIGDPIYVDRNGSHGYVARTQREAENVKKEYENGLNGFQTRRWIKI
ncbi:pirin-like [Styela clava]